MCLSVICQGLQGLQDYGLDKTKALKGSSLQTVDRAVIQSSIQKGLVMIPSSTGSSGKDHYLQVWRATVNECNPAW